jgi:hypothetical protein
VIALNRQAELLEIVGASRAAGRFARVVCRQHECQDDEQTIDRPENDSGDCEAPAPQSAVAAIDVAKCDRPQDNRRHAAQAPEEKCHAQGKAHNGLVAGRAPDWRISDVEDRIVANCRLRHRLLTPAVRASHQHARD